MALIDGKPFLLQVGRLIDGTGAPAREAVVIFIEHGAIQAIGHPNEIKTPSGIQILDLQDRTVLPGLVDAHMHFFGVPSDQLHLYYSEPETNRALRAAGEARKMLEAGITAARCLGSSVSPALRLAINAGHIPGPRLVAAGEFICSTSGTWDHFSVPLAMVKANDVLADGVEGMRAIVRRRVRQGANVIKVGLSKGGIDDRYHAWGDDPWQTQAAYGLDEVRALTDEAHRNGLKVSAHCIGDAAVLSALDGGVDVIEHGYAITDDTRRLLVDQNTLVVSTISQLHFHQQAADPYNYPAWMRAVFQRHIEAMRSDFEKNLERGVRYALGTDLVGYPTHPQDQAAKEFELAVEWGMSPMQAIIAGTQISAEALGMEKMIGTLEVGKLADIVGVRTNPLNDIRSLQHIDFVMQAGQVIVNRPGDGNHV